MKHAQHTTTARTHLNAAASKHGLCGSSKDAKEWASAPDSPGSHNKQYGLHREVRPGELGNAAGGCVHC
jgi:hypothetical protein